jgi:hypothetical protein
MYCQNCGTAVNEGERYCQSCGAPLAGPATPESVPYHVQWEPVSVNKKDPTAALLLGLLPGLIGFWGIGHIYAGSVLKGLLIMFTGWALIFLTLLTGPFSLCFFIVGLVLWLSQSFDAYRTAAMYNSRRPGWP